MRHHIESFNYLLEDGLQRAVESIRPQELVDPHGRWVVLALEAASIGLPTADMKNVHAKSVQVFPSEVGVAIAQGVGYFYCNCVTPYSKKCSEWYCSLLCSEWYCSLLCNEWYCSLLCSEWY